MKKRSLLFRITLLFILSRLFFLVAAQLAPRFSQTAFGYLGSQVSSGEPHFIWELANMDGRHYIWVAQNGYSGSNFAFFPLYPFLIATVHQLTSLSFIYSGILISVLSIVGAIYFLVRLIQLEVSRASVIEPVLLLLFFPLSFILNSVYADALFLFFSTAAFYYARKRKWAVCGIFAALASMTRLTGLALFPALVLEWWIQMPSRKINLTTVKKFVGEAAIAPFLNFLGFTIYPIFLQVNYGNWRLFQLSMKVWKQEKFTTVINVVYRYTRIFETVSPHQYVYWIAVLEFTTFFLYVGLSIYVFKKIRSSYGVFMLILLFLVTFTGTFAGTPRYILHLFPAFIGLSMLLKNNQYLRFIYYPVTLLLGFVLIILFTQGYFVT